MTPKKIMRAASAALAGDPGAQEELLNWLLALRETPPMAYPKENHRPMSRWQHGALLFTEQGPTYSGGRGYAWALTGRANRQTVVRLSNAVDSPGAVPRLRLMVCDPSGGWPRVVASWDHPCGS